MRSRSWMRSACGTSQTDLKCIYAITAIRSLTLVWLKSESSRELKRSGPESRDHREWAAKVWIGSRTPVAVIDAAIVELCQRVLHVVQIGLLEVGVVENVVRFCEKLHVVTLSDPECPRQIQVHVVYAGATETIEFLAGHNREINFRVVKHGGVRAAAGKIQ